MTRPGRTPAHTTTAIGVRPAPDPQLQLWSAAFTVAVRPLTGRKDLTVHVGLGTSVGAPACIHFDLRLIEIDAALIGDPSAANPYRAKDRPKYAAAYGALVHEAAHAVHSVWRTPPGTPALVGEVAEQLEESRIEAAHRRRRTRDKRWLRAAVTTILQPATFTTDSVWHAATAAALILARADTRLLERRDVAPVRKAVTAILGRQRLGRLRALWRQAHQCPDHDGATMLALAGEWLQALGIDPSCPDPTAGQPPGTVLSQAVGAVIAAVAATIPATPPTPGPPPPPRPPSPPDPKTAASKVVFGDRTAVQHWPTRAPTPAERQAAAALARALRHASTSEPVTTAVAAALPPGRLNLRQAITAHAQKASGQIPTALPWRTSQRRPDPQPPRRVGACVDVSGSMNAFAKPMSSAAWIITRGAAYADATTATVAFGPAVTALIRPGENPPHVRELQTGGGTNFFDHAILGLDAALGLSRPGATRLLIVVSDGDMPASNNVQTLLDQLTATGCAVIWIAPPQKIIQVSGVPIVRLADLSQLPAVVTAAFLTGSPARQRL